MNERTAIERILDLLEKHGPLNIDQIIEKLNIHRQTTYTACQTATLNGYLAEADRVKLSVGKGRKSVVYARTDKPYSYVESARVRYNNARRERERDMTAERIQERKQLAAFIPFRHPLDEVFFGPWTQPVQVSTVPRRTVEGWSV